MTHLVYEPEPLPRLFLWGEDRFRHPAVERLTSLGRHATARIVTDYAAVKRVRGTAIELLDATTVLAALETDDLERVPASVAAWSLAAKLGLDLIARERIVPLVQHGGSGMEARWGVSLALPEDAERFSRLARAFPPAAHAAPHAYKGQRAAARKRRSVHVWAPEALLVHFADALADTLVRRAAARARPRGERGARGISERGPWEEELIAALSGPDPTFRVDGFLARTLPDELAQVVDTGSRRRDDIRPTALPEARPS